MFMAIHKQPQRKPHEHPIDTKVSYQSILDGWIAGDVVEELKERLLKVGKEFAIIKSGSCVRGLAICEDSTRGSDVDVTIVVPDEVADDLDDYLSKCGMPQYEDLKREKITKQKADNILNRIRSEKGVEIERNRKKGKRDQFLYSMVKLRGPILTESEFFALMSEAERKLGTDDYVGVPISATRYDVHPETFLSAYAQGNSEVFYDGLGIESGLKERASEISKRDEIKLAGINSLVSKVKRLSHHGYGGNFVDGVEYVSHREVGATPKVRVFSSMQQTLRPGPNLSSQAREAYEAIRP